tara:strand:- start:449 stop:1621 length:1173 start_codon:yes stop_codon:yes gene_type:complete
MREIDLLVGGIFTRIFNFFLFLKSRQKLPIKEDSIKNILVVKFFGIGSIILSTPMARALKVKFPNAKITLVTFEQNREFVKRLDLYDQVLCFQNRNLFFFLCDFVRNLIWIWNLRVDIVVDVEFFSNFTYVLSLLSFAKYQVGFYQRQVPRGRKYTHPTHLNTHKHITWAFCLLAIRLGAKPEEINHSSLDLQLPSNEDLNSLNHKLGFDIRENFVVTVNPNASHLSYLRRWPPEHFASLLSKLNRKYPEWKLVLIGSPIERTYTQKIEDQAGVSGIINTTGNLFAGELCALIYQSQLIVTNDSLPLHISSAYGKNVAVFFGPESPRVYGPLNSNSIVFFEDIYCSPCLNSFDKSYPDCQNNICLKQIEVDSVIEKIENKLLDVNASSPP